jgi:hypothetical protein
VQLLHPELKTAPEAEKSASAATGRRQKARSDPPLRQTSPAFRRSAAKRL